MVIFKRELLRNLKGLLIWTASIAGLLLLMVTQFKAMEGGVNTAGYTDQFKTAMGMDKLDMNTFLGYYAIKASIMVTLFGSIYAAMLGSGLIVKDESLLSRPVSRVRVITERFLAATLNLFVLNAVICLVIYVSEKDSLIISISVAQFLLHILFAAVGLLVAIIKIRSKAAIILPIGVVLATYVFSLVYGMSEKLEPLKYLTPFWYTDCKDIIINGEPEAGKMVVAATCVLVLLIISYFDYIRKDLPS